MLLKWYHKYVPTKASFLAEHSSPLPLVLINDWTQNWNYEMSVMYHDKRCRLAILIFDNMKYYLLYKRVGLGILAIGNWRVYCTCCQETFFGYHSLDVLFRSCNVTHLLYFYSIHLTSYPWRTTTQERKKCATYENWVPVPNSTSLCSLDKPIF